MRTGQKSPGRKGRVWVGRLCLLALGTLVPCLVLEFFFRSMVARNGLTPFASSSVEGVPYELRRDFQTLYKGVLVSLNGDGLRGPALGTRQPDRLRIVLTGDSFTFGNGVPDEDTIPAQLGRPLAAANRPAEVINAGVPGFNLENVVNWVESRLLELEPDVLVYIFFSNDVCSSKRASEVPADAVIDPFHDFPLGSAFLQWTGVRASGLMRAFGVERDSGYVASICRLHRETGEPRMREGFARLRDLCEEHDIRLLIADHPFMLRVDRNPFQEIDSAAARISEELGIEFLDLGDAFAPDEDLTAYWVNPFDSHPNRASHERTAALLAEVLLAE